MSIGESIGPLCEELLEDDVEHHLYGDNQAACRSFEDSTSNWRTRHLRMRATAGRERVQLGTWSVMHIPGQFQLADIATKPLPGARLAWLLQLMRVRPYEPDPNLSVPSAIPVGTGKSENQKGKTAKVTFKTPVEEKEKSPRSNGTPDSRLNKPLNVGEPCKSKDQTRELDVAQATATPGTANPVQVRLALITMIMASLLCQSKGSREMIVLEQENSSASRFA